MPSRAHAERLDSLFHALGDPTRRRLVELLATRPRAGATATGLASELPITRQAVAKHLDALRRARLVRSARVGRETRFELEAKTLAEVTAWADRVAAEWDDRLDRLERTLARRRPEG